MERTERDIEEKKTVLDESEDTNGDHDKAKTEDEGNEKAVRIVTEANEIFLDRSPPNTYYID